MNQQLSEIKEALSKATPGPWYTDKYDVEYDPFSNDESKRGTSLKPIAKLCGGYTPNPNHENDAHLIANAPQWLASLVSEVEEMQKTLTIVRDTLEHKKNDDRTSWSLWNDANTILQSLKGEAKHD